MSQGVEGVRSARKVQIRAKSPDHSCTSVITYCSSSSKLSGLGDGTSFSIFVCSVSVCECVMTCVVCVVVLCGVWSCASAAVLCRPLRVRVRWPSLCRCSARPQSEAPLVHARHASR